MKEIVEPKAAISKLWGKQQITIGVVYRLMHYTLRVDYNGKVLLHNVVTGQMVELEQAEAEVLERLPMLYNPVMECLVAEHYLVPEDYDEHLQVINLRRVLNRLDEAKKSPGITTYTILTTTACNARCYYCYEQGSRTVTMTEETADDIITFIKNHCRPEKKVFLTWFGGEPTLASNRIAQICSGLEREGILYESKIITNGYLFDEHMVAEAKNLWRLNFAQICVDGTERNYNYIKSYVGVRDNPYQRVMRNVQLLLDAGIHIRLRMNFDIGNYQDFEPFAEEAGKRFNYNPLLQVSVHPVIGSYPNREGKVIHGNEEWFEKAIVELNDIAIDKGVCRRNDELPCLNYRLCMAAADNAVTITPEGAIVRCPERFDDSQIVGTIRDGITDWELMYSWKKVADIEECKNCEFFPECISISNCLTSGLCYDYAKRIKEKSANMIARYQSVNIVN